MATGIYITQNGKAETVQLDGSLDQLQFMLGGDIEGLLVPTAHGNAMLYFAAEGKFMGLAPNRPATKLLHGAGGAGYDYIAGFAVLVGAPDENGEDTDIPAGLAAELIGGAA